jgi:hypothetical protein
MASLEIKGRNKLGPRFYSPFCILERIGSWAYKLELPARARLHNVYHVGLLKPYHGASPRDLEHFLLCTTREFALSQQR